MYEQSAAACSLLELPDVALCAIFTRLEIPDKIKFMAACRKTASLAMPDTEIMLRLKQESKFAGIRTVLDMLVAKIHLYIVCPRNLEALRPANRRPLSAMSLFMGMVPDLYTATIASKCCWEGITKVTIQGTYLRCLLPQFLALTCPQLEQLTVMQFDTDDDGNQQLFTADMKKALPLPLCSSLKHLEISSEDQSNVDLPPQYHSQAELLNSLPNIDTLIMKVANADLVLAFAAQLTRLEVRQCLERVKEPLQLCTRLQHLAVGEVLMLPENATALRALEIKFKSFSDADLEKVLQLPSVTTLHFAKIKHIEQDWSRYPCSWQELDVETIGFTALAHLNLRNLKKMTSGPDTAIHLPDPCMPDSRALVQKAVDSLAHVGKIVIKDSSLAGEYGTLVWHIPSSNNEQAAADLLTIAAQRVGPVRAYNCENFLHRTLLLEAAFAWGATFIETLCFGYECNIQLHVWQALSQLHRLKTLVFWVKNSTTIRSKGAQEDDKLLVAASLVCTAAQHSVIPGNRSLCLEFGFYEDDDEQNAEEDEHEGDSDGSGDDDGEDSENKGVVESKAFLLAAITEGLPCSCKVTNVVYASKEACEFYQGYGHALGSDTCWVVEVEPLTESPRQ